MDENETDSPPAEPSELEAARKRKAELDERDRELMERLLAGDRQASGEACLRLNGLMERACARDTPKLLRRFAALRGAAFELLGRWLFEKRNLRPDEPLPFLARRLWKQAMEAEARADARAARTVSLDQGWEEADPGEASRLAGRREQLERKIGAAAPPADPERLYAQRELQAWLERARERLSETDRATWEAIERVEDGAAGSLGEALGVTLVAARQRSRRLRVALVELALADGIEEIVERAKRARAVRSDQGKKRTGDDD